MTEFKLTEEESKRWNELLAAREALKQLIVANLPDTLVPLHGPGGLWSTQYPNNLAPGCAYAEKMYLLHKDDDNLAMSITI